MEYLNYSQEITPNLSVHFSILLHRSTVRYNKILRYGFNQTNKCSKKCLTKEFFKGRFREQKNLPPNPVKKEDNEAMQRVRYWC